MNKYLKGGSLNPEWVNEQIIAKEKEEIMESLNSLRGFSTNLELQLAEGVNLIVGEAPSEAYNTGIESYTLEEKFQFIKNHSDNPEDLKLAREILGLDK